MIGSALAIRYYARKPWMIALAFWAVYLIIGIVFGSTILSSAETSWWLGAVFSFLVFMALAIFWLRLVPMIAIICFAIAYVIDFIIMYFLAMVGFSLSSILGGLI